MKEAKNPLIKIENLSKFYSENKNNPVYALNDVNLEIYKGETFGIVGESGCGKSTLGQIIVNLIKPTKGKVIFCGDKEEKDIHALKSKDMKELRKKLQIVFQDPYSSINPQKTIGWLLEEPLIIYKTCKSKSERKKLVEDMLVSVGLDQSYINRYPSELSGGQRQRVAIAIALILNPEFVVCDEAVSALDVSVQAQIINLLIQLQKKLNLTYLFISHNINVIAYISDRIGVMYLGEIVELGDAEKIFESPAHPYTKALFSAAVNIRQEFSPIVLKGEPPSKFIKQKGCVFAARCPYCTEKCLNEKPILRELSDGRKLACHLLF